MMARGQLHVAAGDHADAVGQVAGVCARRVAAGAEDEDGLADLNVVAGLEQRRRVICRLLTKVPLALPTSRRRKPVVGGMDLGMAARDLGVVQQMVLLTSRPMVRTPCPARIACLHRRP